MMNTKFPKTQDQFVLEQVLRQHYEHGVNSKATELYKLLNDPNFVYKLQAYSNTQLLRQIALEIYDSVLFDLEYTREHNDDIIEDVIAGK